MENLNGVFVISPLEIRGNYFKQVLYKRKQVFAKIRRGM
jgi:hypothetical protein